MTTTPTPRRRRPVGPRLRWALRALTVLMLVMLVNSAYLGGVALLQYVAEERGAPVQLEGWAFQWFFLVHVVLGLLLLVPAVVFVAGHLRAVRGHPNRRAARFGYALLAVSVVLLVSGVALTRIDGIGLRLADPAARSITYWAHVGSAVLVVGIFALHRRAGGGLRPRRVAPWLAVGGALTAAAVALHLAGPSPTRPDLGEERLFPALSATAHGGTIPTEALMNDDYCLACHPDVHERWSHSAHRFSSFNNPAYRFSVLATRAKMRERDGDVSGARFCAGCHDPVPLFAGVYDDPAFDDPAHLDVDPAASAGITCTVCHAITSIDSVKGNADYTIAEPVHYPFADAEGGVLQWINHQLVKANPAFHKRTFLKPLHESAEFCGACHKVHLPEELNDYKWLRGQNHYDAFLLSGASGHGVASWYYPESAEAGCNACHMELRASSDFGAADNDGSGRLTVHDHLFPSANAAIPQLLGSPDWVTEAHQDFNDRTARLDVFALREGGTIDGPLVAPLRPELPALHPGATYLVDVVIRTLRMGHPLTQGTADSNQLWLDVTVRADGEVIGRSGGLDEDRALDPWSHHVNAFVLDRDGRRIDRRNAEDIFVPLYNNQIPPGAADTVHYRLDVPVDAREITIDAALRYRKFDTQYLRLFMGDPALRNDLPILTLATDSVTLPVGTAPGTTEPRDIPEWQRWYDYGIGAIRKRGTGELRTAELAFDRVAQLGRGAGHLAVARVLLREGRLDGAAARINLAAAHEDPPPPWSIAWFTGLVNRRTGNLDAAADNLRRLHDMHAEPAARARGFDFRPDTRLLVELALIDFERARRFRDAEVTPKRDALLTSARRWYEAALEVDPEHAAAQYGLSRVLARLGDEPAAARHLAEYERYRIDDNARDQAISAARARYPAANRAAEAIVIYDLHRPGAPELPVERAAEVAGP